MKRVLALLAGLFFWTAAHAVTVNQSGTSVTPNSVPYWVTNGVIGSGVSAADSPVSSFGVTSTSSAGICANSARQSAGGWNSLCLGFVSGVPTLYVQNFGSATAQPLQMVVNGTTYPFPGSLATITIGVTGIIGGTNANCLVVSGSVVGQQSCNVSSITSLTGDVTGTGPGVTATTLATVNPNTGTFGNGSTVPSFTVNGKGLITAVSTAPVSVTVGTSAINSGSNNGVLYDNGGVLGNLSTLGGAVLVTSVGGVPSMATTLPSALTIPTPTFTGTLTFPDAATWTNVGISKVVALSAGSATLPSSGNISVSGQYQVNGTQIAASNLSNGTTGSGSVVLATSPTMAGTWAGSVTFSGALTLSGNDTFTAQAIHQGTSAPASAAGNTVVMGTIAAPTLANTAQAFLYNTAANGAVLQGDGSSFDIVLANKSGGAAMQLTTGTTVPVWPGLSAGTCSSGLALDASNNMVKTSCPGAASAIQVGTTTITSGSSGNIEFNNAGVLGELTPNGGVTKSGTNLQQDGNYGGWALQNCTLAASVGSNLLTVALKDNAGSDPSATSPCSINYRNVTASTGSTTLVQQTAALSISTNATGASLGSSNGTPFRFWVVAFNNSGTNVLALFNASTANTCNPINEGVAASSTAISGSATSAGVYYTPNGTTVTSKSFRILGYVEYGAGLATAGTYASGPTIIQAFGPGIRRPCEPVQVQRAVSAAVATGSTTVPIDDTIPQNTEGNQYLTQAITPTSTVNPLRVEVLGNFSSSTSSTNFVGALFQDSGANAVAVTAMQISNALQIIALPLNWQQLPGVSAGTSTTFNFRAGTGAAGTTTFNGISAARQFGGTMNSFLQITEIMG